ncbi:AzlD domain-containing protein [Paenibacillus wynnii]|uniref:AzlD domain-containing protein n=1 Tax=Paenibacillus wynnii TaxID=268407 RepID=UPI00278EABA6|nr:branched-subunit amino acid transport protein [Paenibacillus wynnii]
MGFITFILRVFPLYLLKIKPVEQGNNGFINFLPLSVLCALTIPGIFKVDDTDPFVGTSAGLTALLLVLWGKMPFFGVICLSVLVALIVKLI